MVWVGNRERLPDKAIFAYDVCRFDCRREIVGRPYRLAFLYNILEGQQERILYAKQLTYEGATRFSEREMASISIPCPCGDGDMAALVQPDVVWTFKVETVGVLLTKNHDQKT